jgi:hypothetical protein
MRSKYILKIGAEMEGGWDFKPKRLGYDGSVHVDAPYVGEVRSPAFLWIESLLRWIRRWHPQYVDESCGLHIHVSFRNNLYYSQLMSEEFYRYFLEKTKAWAKKKEKEGLDMDIFWDRWNGYNDYCRKRFDPESQAQATDKESCRYAHLNYCFSIRGTLECRLFPMFETYELSCEAVRLFYRIVNSWLRKYERAEKEEMYTLVLLDDEREEVKVEKNKEVL